MENCKAIREGDEWACSCGLRWDVDEPDPHKQCHQCEHYSEVSKDVSK